MQFVWNRINKNVDNKVSVLSSAFPSLQSLHNYNIVFINLYRNGDIYMSSQFVIDLVSKHKTNYKYVLLIPEHVSADNWKMHNIPIVSYNDNQQYGQLNYTGRLSDTEKFITINHDTHEIIVNTCVGCFPGFYPPGYLGGDLHMNCIISGAKGVNIGFYYETFKTLYDLLNIKMERVDYYIPSFNQPNFSEYNESYNFYKNIYSRIKTPTVLICNGQGFSWGQILDEKVISLFLDNGFYVKVTHPEMIKSPELLERYTNNTIIPLPPTKLYDNAVIAEFSDFIVGVSSGLFITTMTKESLSRSKFILVSDTDLVFHNNLKLTRVNFSNMLDGILMEINT